MYGKVGTLQKSKTGGINCPHNDCSVNTGFDCGGLELLNQLYCFFSLSELFNRQIYLSFSWRQQHGGFLE